MKQKVCVTGAGGFIGTHLVRRLKEDGYWVRGVDLRYPRWSRTEADEFRLLDLRFVHDAAVAMQGVDWVFHLAADMGGMGYITSAEAEIIRNNGLINLHTIEAARQAGVERLLFSSSACVYPTHLQGENASRPLAEEDVYPASPQASYGWEKLNMEVLCQHYRKASWLDTRIVRFHNCYGPLGDWRGGREKAPAALCRKVAVAKLTGNPQVEIWGDGQQVRSFMYVEDAVEGLVRLMSSDFPKPVNIGRDRTVTIDELVDTIASIAEFEVEKVHVPSPEGVRWRNSDNALCQRLLDWEPSVPIEKGLSFTYRWIERQVEQVLARGELP